MIAHLPLPRLAAHPADLPQVFVTRQRRPGVVAVPPDPGVPPGRDEDAGVTALQRPVHLPLVVGPVRRHADQRPVGRLEQPVGLLGVIDARLGQAHRLDLVALGVEGQVQLPPRPPPGVAVLPDLPLPLAEDLQARAVEDEVERPFTLTGQAYLQVGGPPGEGAVVGHLQVQAHQLEERLAEPLSRTQRQVEDGPEGEQAGDSEVAVDVLGTPLVGPAVAPGVDGLLVHPDGQRAPPDEGLVVLTPVADAVDGLPGALAHRPSLPKPASPTDISVQQRRRADKTSG